MDYQEKTQGRNVIDVVGEEKSGEHYKSDVEDHWCIYSKSQVFVEERTDIRVI